MKMVVNVPAWLQQVVSENKSVPEWFAAIQQKKWAEFIKSGLPTCQDERWKYSDLSSIAHRDFSQAKKTDPACFFDVIHQHRLQRENSILLVLVNGYFVRELSDMDKLPGVVKVCQLKEALVEHAAAIQSLYSLYQPDIKKYPFANLNAAVCSDGLFIYLPDYCELEMPIHLLSIGDDSEFAAHPHHLMILNPHSKLTFVEEYFSLSEQAYLMNIMMTVQVNKHAQLTHYKIQHEGKQAAHIASHFIHQMQDSQVNLMNFSFGGLLARDDLAVNLHESRAACQASGFDYPRQRNQHVGHHIDIQHQAPCTHSDMLYKGIVDNKSRAVFNGRVFVGQEAQKIEAYQANHYLLLSHEAEIVSKPELEIYADEIKCKHGATTGQVDQEALFYLCSRGISREEAVYLLLQGFAEEVMQRISHPSVKRRVQEMMV